MDGNLTPQGNSPARKVSVSSKPHRRQSGSSTDTEGEEDSESESESSSSSKTLRSFRKQWQAELKKDSSNSGNKDDKRNSTPIQSSQIGNLASSCYEHTKAESTIPDTEEEAKQLFLMGVGLERQGDLYDAVRHYRRAMQLVPDIEYRVNQNDTPANEANSPNDSDNDESIHEASDPSEDCDDGDKDLPLKFLRIIEANGWHFFQKLKPDTKVHLDNIPVEVITYILRWVVSADLDLRSLDIISSVCRGFYCLSRDEDIWKMACDRVWDSNNYVGVGNEFSTYREMFISRPRVRFDGCYISKVTYVRPGEHSFQDQSYRPWHLVEYYRYLRFFPDGQLYFLTSSDQPGSTVSGLKDKVPRNTATLLGKYKLIGENLVAAVVTKPSTNYNRVGKSKQKTPSPTTTFHMEFEIQEVRGRPNWMLRWTCYSVFINSRPTEMNRNPNNNENEGIATKFELNQNKYPPLYFSRVKSYTGVSEKILS